jgi:spermidine synthase
MPSKRMWELFLLSFMSLFFELLVIRWVTADVRAFSVLKSFPLAACCIGLGAGCALPTDRMYKLLPISLAAFAVLTVTIADSPLATVPFPTATYNWLSFHDGQTGSMTWQWCVYFVACTIVLITSLSGPFLASLAIGSRLGALFRSMEPLKAYSVNVAGALLGTVVFAAFSFLNWPPAWLMVVPAVYCVAAMWEGLGTWKVALPAAIAVVVALMAPSDHGWTAVWTPYQRIDYLSYAPSDKVLGYELKTNHWPYQCAYDLTPARLQSPALSDNDKKEYGRLAFRHDFPYAVKQPVGSVLIFGSGMGNDVASAIRAHASAITAVELDPAILKLGQQFHPEHPYASPVVTAICDDARHFANTTQEKFDLVVFSHLDSQSVLSQSSAIRLDNFIYTKESVQRALQLVKPGGLVVVSFCTREPWFISRLYDTISSAAGYKPAAYSDTHGIPNTFFVLGDSVKDGSFQLPADIAAKVVPLKTEPGDRILTDDWPFLYLAPVSFDIGYFLICLEILAVCALFGGKTVMRHSSAENWQLFFLGAGFLLLELQAIARLSVLLGTTWLTSSVIISGVLIMILLANYALMKKPALCEKQNLAYAGLFMTLVVSYALPVAPITEALPRIAACAVITAITVSPMLCAAIIFGSRFSKVRDPGAALGFNLMGTVLGALLEYGSNYLGIKNMLIVAAILYLTSYLASRRAGTAAPQASAQPATD